MRKTKALSARAHRGKGRQRISPRLQSPQIHRPGAKFLRQRGRFGPHVLLYPHARAGRVAENAVLNANYLLAKIKHFLPVPNGERCMHEFVATASKLKADRDISALDIAKRLLDYGFHAPTIYFPLIVREAMMIEPTETESRATLDAFVEALFRITEEPYDLLHEAPHATPVSRPDEVLAARNPVLKWKA